jgi:hypothetical protein
MQNRHFRHSDKGFTDVFSADQFIFDQGGFEGFKHEQGLDSQLLIGHNYSFVAPSSFSRAGGATPLYASCAIEAVDKFSEVAT